MSSRASWTIPCSASFVIAAMAAVGCSSSQTGRGNHGTRYCESSGGPPSAAQVSPAGSPTATEPSLVRHEHSGVVWMQMDRVSSGEVQQLEASTERLQRSVDQLQTPMERLSRQLAAQVEGEQIKRQRGFVSQTMDALTALGLPVREVTVEPGDNGFMFTYVEGNLSIQTVREVGVDDQAEVTRDYILGWVREFHRRGMRPHRVTYPAAALSWKESELQLPRIERAAVPSGAN